MINENNGKENRNNKRRNNQDSVLQKLDRLFQKAEGSCPAARHHEIEPDRYASGQCGDARHRGESSASFKNCRLNNRI